MAFYTLNLQTTGHHSETLSDYLFLTGALAVTFLDPNDQPIIEPDPGEIKMWPTVTVSGMYQTTDSVESILTLLKKLDPKLNLKSYKINDIADQDWVRITQANFDPIIVKDKLCILPSWKKPLADHYSNIILDPGLAFGTGTHPTTLLCLQWLVENVHAGDVVVDFGCGSGILSLAALALGAKKVYAIDHDQQALAATKNNLALNNFAGEIIISNDSNDLTTSNDILVANIIANTLETLCPLFNSITQAHSRIALSGILRDQVNHIEESFGNFYKLNATLFLEDWALVSGTKKA